MGKGWGIVRCLLYVCLCVCVCGCAFILTGCGVVCSGTDGEEDFEDE